MEFEFTKQFIRVLKKYEHDKQFVRSIGKRINEANVAVSIVNIHGLEIIRGTSIHFRFKIKAQSSVYRIGIKKLKKVIWFA